MLRNLLDLVFNGTVTAIVVCLYIGWVIAGRYKVRQRYNAWKKGLGLRYHGELGQAILYTSKLGCQVCFAWNDDENKLLCTVSRITTVGQQVGLRVLCQVGECMCRHCQLRFTTAIREMGREHTKESVDQT